MKISELVLMKFDHSVRSKNYTTQYKVLSRDFILTHNAETIDNFTKKIMTRGSEWILLLGDFQHSNIEIKEYKKSIKVHGKTAILIPPFNFITLNLSSGVFERFEIYFSELPTTIRTIDKPITFLWNGELVPDDSAQIAEWVASAREVKEISVDYYHSKVLDMAKAVKHCIDRNYKAPLKITDIANELNLNRSHMTKSFKKVYGFSPLYWRQIVRMFDALKAMNNGGDITHSIYASGYASVAQYLLFFKKWFHVTPKHHRIPRK